MSNQNIIGGSNEQDNYQLSGAIELSDREMETVTGGLFFLKPLIVFAASKAIIYGIDKVTGRDNNAY